jgi:hypothetical protein
VRYVIYIHIYDISMLRVNLAQVKDRWQAGCCDNGIELSGSVNRARFYCPDKGVLGGSCGCLQLIIL